jgi:hypothetical protein
MAKKENRRSSMLPALSDQGKVVVHTKRAGHLSKGSGKQSRKGEKGVILDGSEGGVEDDLDVVVSARYRRGTIGNVKVEAFAMEIRFKR